MKKIVTDHTGTTYNSITEMCEAWGIKRTTFIMRKKSGLTTQDSLTLPLHTASIMETKMMRVLDKMDILYFHDVNLKKVFKELDLGFDYDENEKNYRYDFVLVIDGMIYCVELDGEQHFHWYPKFQKEASDLLSQHAKDMAKDALCEEYLIPLLRIRYDQQDHMENIIRDFLRRSDAFLFSEHSALPRWKYWQPYDFEINELRGKGAL